jgi:HSP20 family protein
MINFLSRRKAEAPHAARKIKKEVQVMMMTNLVPSNLHQELTTWHRDIDDLFRRFFSEGGEETQSLTNWSPRLEVFERDGQYIVRADIPGVNPNEIELSVVDDALLIRGERKKSSEVEDKNYHYSETAYGRFERRLALPKGVDRDKIAAKFENGVLEIAVPLPASATGKKVPIEIAANEAKKLQAA